jgi:pyridinium-3,5-biscarboxylic acid mononucleotide synthase
VRTDQVRQLLESVAAGRVTPEDGLERLAWLPVEPVAADGAGADQAYARVDHHRATRQGYPEVVFGEGKTPEQVVGICQRLESRGDGFLVTRADDATRAALVASFPAAVVHPRGRIVHLAGARAGAAPVEEPTGAGAARQVGPVLVVTAGTGDLPVAEEAAVTAAALGEEVRTLNDVGVAGLHRILAESALLREAGVVIVVAGMEGALASVVGGLVRAPVIAVPTSIGYGAAFGGVAALLGMLTSCAAGVTVVNIDNGFGAACAAHRINQRARGRA